MERDLLDKIITVLSPKRGIARQNYRRMGAVMGAWVGARFDRKATQSWLTVNGSADADSLPDLPTLPIRCRDLMRNESLAGGAVTNLVRDVVGTGLSIHPKPDWEALGIPRMKRSIGHKTRLQVIEADCVHSPNGDSRTVKYFSNAAAAQAEESTTSGPIWGGVECDDNGAPVAYYILDQHPGSLGFNANPNAWKRYAAFGSRTNRRLILHLFDKERPEQKGGISHSTAGRHSVGFSLHPFPPM